ncbi:MAG: ferrous iron transport protein A [Lachnospiraceae bacterium]|jgi:ferrous iron transport protein A|nr:ferrous iron transport protein A [Lachnospiraceae bacterium]MBR3581692.1 ferrous iron transport protein A [Lachnospiraceae bacterium]
MVLTEAKEGMTGRIRSVGGTPEYQRRITSVGLTPGCVFNVIQNRTKQPVLIYARNTQIALDRSDCEKIETEVVS